MRNLHLPPSPFFPLFSSRVASERNSRSHLRRGEKGLRILPPPPPFLDQITRAIFERVIYCRGRERERRGGEERRRERGGGNLYRLEKERFPDIRSAPAERETENGERERERVSYLWSSWMASFHPPISCFFFFFTSFSLPLTGSESF